MTSTVPPSPRNFTPVKLEHAEQLELGYMPLRDDFEKAQNLITLDLYTGTNYNLLLFPFPCPPSLPLPLGV